MTNTDRFYVTGGNVPADALSYITRNADGALLDCLLKGEFCYILTSRQMGKSSLMTQMVKQLREHDVTPAVLDLSGQGFNLDARQWYNGLLEQLGRRLNLETEMESFCCSRSHLSPLQLWQKTLRDVVLESKPEQITVFIDEIDVVRNLAFSTDEFFAAIRACYNARTEDPAFSRLNFCLLGVATPADLISNPKLTPFNIGTRIELGDFTRQEASLLEHGLGHDPGTNRSLLDRIYHWTSGHPYLTQRLCEAVAEDGAILTDRGVDSCVEQLFLTVKAQRQDSNLQFVQQRMLPSDDEQRAALLAAYSEVRRGMSVSDSDTTPFVSALKLAGIVRAARGRLFVRNGIYSHVFGSKWITENMPDAEMRRQKAAFRKGALRTMALTSIIVFAIAGLSVLALQERNDARRHAVRERTARKEADANADLAEQRLYLADMELIQREWEINNGGHVLELLEETRNYKHKGFEWGYWNRLCHLELLTLKGHPQSVVAIALSPDGKRIVTGSSDRTVISWDATTGRVMHILKGLTETCENAAISPDTSMIVTVRSARTAKVWETATGRLIFNLGGPNVAIYSAAFSPGSNRIVTGEKDGSAKVWDIATGRAMRTVRGLASPTNSVAFSQDGKRILTGASYKNAAQLWDAATGREICTFTGHTGPIHSTAFSPDGKRAVTASADRTARVWDASTGRAIFVLKGDGSSVWTAKFSHDGKRIVAGNADGTAKVWDAQTGNELLTIKGHAGPVHTVAFSADNWRVLTGSADKTVKVWDSNSQSGVLVIRGHKDDVLSVAFSPDGKRILTGSLDGAAKVWDATTGREKWSVKHAPSVFCTVFSPDGSLIATGGADKTARIWDANTGRDVQTLSGHRYTITSVAFFPDGKYLVTGCKDRSAKIWEVQTGREVLTLKGHSHQILSVAVSRDGTRIATGCRDGTAKVWEAQTGREILTLKGHTNAISSVSFFRDGSRIVTGSWDSTVKVWDAHTGREISSLKGLTVEVLSVAVSCDGNRIVSGSVDATIRVWDTQSGRELLTLKGQTGPVSSVAFSPDGRSIVAGNGNNVTEWFSDSNQRTLAMRDIITKNAPLHRRKVNPTRRVN